MSTQCFPENSLLLNFSLCPLTFRPNAMLCGKTWDFCQQNFFYINKYDFVLISKHQKTNQLMICQLTIKANPQGKIIDYWNYQECSLGPSDQIRIYKDVLLGKLGWGSKLLSDFMKVGQRGTQDNHFFIKFDKIEKKWMGCWGLPQKNWYVKIQQIALFLAKQRKISVMQTNDAKFLSFEWALQPVDNKEHLEEQNTNNNELDASEQKQQ